MFIGDNLQEIDVLRVMFYIICMMVSFVTITKQLRIKGLFGTSNMIISIGTLILTVSLVSQTILTVTNYQDEIWLSIFQVSILILSFIGFGFIFFGLWKIIVFFDELKASVKISIQPKETEE